MSANAIRGTATTAIALWGQSNALGREAVESPVPATGELWVDGVEVSTFGLLDRLSVEALLSPNRRVTKTAVGGTEISEWLATLLATALANVTASGLTPRVLIWIQGEADAREAGGWVAYESNLMTLITTAETAIGQPFDLILIPLLSGLPSGIDDYPRMAEINAAFQAVATARGDVVLIPTVGIEKQGDDVHYTRRGYDTIAVLMRDELVRRGL